MKLFLDASVLLAACGSGLPRPRSSVVGIGTLVAGLTHGPTDGSHARSMIDVAELGWLNYDSNQSDDMVRQNKSCR